MKKKITTILLTIILFSSVAFSVSAQETNSDNELEKEGLFLSISEQGSDIGINTSKYGIKGETLGVTVFYNELRVQRADVYFVLNNGTPIHLKTDSKGNVNYKPLLRGLLKITVEHKGDNLSEFIPIYEPFYDFEISSDALEKEIYTGETANYLLTVQNIGNTTDEIDIVIQGVGSLNKGSVLLGVKEKNDIVLSVSKSTIGTYKTEVTGTSKKDPSKNDSVTITTKVKIRSSGVNGGLMGGFGGGAGSGGGRDIPETSIKTDSRGMVLFTYTKESSDKKAKIIIPNGTIALDFEGNPLRDIKITSIKLEGKIIAAYDLKPDYAKFYPEVELVIKYDPEEAENKDLVIKIYEYGKWSELETKINQSENTATAKISNFTLFALFAEEEGSIRTSFEFPSSPIQIVDLPTPTEEQTTTNSHDEDAPIVPWSWVIASILAVVIMLMVLYIWGR